MTGVDVSIVVPVYRQWDYVAALTDALTRQDLAEHGAEVIFVDDEPGAPREVSLPERARIVPGPGRGAYAARNAGVEAARGRLLVFTDADCRPRPGWLAALVEAAGARPGALIAGPVEVQGGAVPNRWEIFDIVRGIPQARYVAHGYAATANLAVPANVFHATGGFDGARRSGGDAEFCRRAGRRGYTLHLVPAAVTDHAARDSWGELAGKARRVKGGQIASGTARRRATWIVRTLTPPVREIVHYMLSAHPPRFKRVAAGVRLRLWGVELGETARLLGGGTPRR